MSKNTVETTALYVERDTDRRIRHRNKLYYRFNHWPIWIFVFLIAPGPLTFDLFERGFDARSIAWLTLVLVGTGIAGLRGRLPGCEPAPYIIRFTEDRPNPLYRRICYTTAWGEAIAFAVLNVAGLSWAVLTGEWRLKQLYEVGYFPIAGTVWLLGAPGPAAARARVHGQRGPRAPLLLRFGVGGGRRPAGARHPVEAAAADQRRGCW